MKKNSISVHNGFFLILFLGLIINTAVLGQNIKGRIIGDEGEPLVGASIFIKETGKVVFVELDGLYTLRNFKPGTYHLTISFLSYQTQNQSIDIKPGINQIKPITLKTSALNLRGLSVISSAVQAERKARNLEKNADQLLNVVSSKALELSPDITVGNALQRVSGVTIQKSSSGGGQYAIIRGLDKRYTYTSIEGIILPSPDATQRAVPLDMFPSDLIQRVEVIKSLTPDVEANAIGGAVNNVMKEGPEKLTVSINVSGGISDLFINRSFSGFSRKDIHFKSPIEANGSQYLVQNADLKTSELYFKNVKVPLDFVGGFTLGNRILHGKLGFMFGGSYARQYKGGNTLLYSISGGQYNPSNQPVIPSFQYRQNSFLQDRTGFHSKFTYFLNSNHSFSLYGLFLQLDNNQHQYTVLTPFGSGTDVGAQFFDNVAFNRKNIYHVNLEGNDRISSQLMADWSLSYSEAKATTPDQVSLSRRIETTYPGLYLSALSSNWNHSDDRSKQGKINLKYVPLKDFEIWLGGLYREENRTGYNLGYSQIPQPNPPPNPNVDQLFTTIDKAVFIFGPNGQFANNKDLNNYTAHETVSAFYAELRLNLFHKLNLVLGARVENTKQNYSSQLDSAITGYAGNFHYTDILPGIHLRYSLSDKENLRLSYFAGISRPNLYDLIPTSSNVDLSSDYTTSGNYNLKHATANNIDFRYDNFFSTTTFLIAGVFYKKINNPIEVSTFTLDGTPVTITSSSVYYGPTNPTGGATVYGLELVGSKFFGKFGISGNYSYIHSEVTTLKILAFTNASGINTNTLVNNTRPLQGQASHIGNFSLLFKDPKTGIDAQVSLVYSGKSISLISSYLNLDQWQRAGTQVDFSFNKNISRRLNFYIKINNVFNNNQYLDILRKNDFIVNPQSVGNPGQIYSDKILVKRDVFNRNYLLGIRYKL